MSTDCPSGLVYLLVNELNRELNPSDRIVRVNLRKKLTELTMNKNEDMVQLFERIKTLKNQCSRIMVPNEELIALVIEKTPQLYSGILAAEDRAQGTGLMIGNLEEVMKNQFQIYYSGENPKHKEGN